MNKHIKTAMAGIIGTVALTAFTKIFPMVGMPQMSAPKMLSEMMSIPLFLGWIIHFMIGIIFAFLYAFTLKKWQISSCLKGWIFGFATFIIARMVIGMMISIGSLPELMESLMLHLIFGLATTKIIEGCECSNHSCSKS